MRPCHLLYRSVWSLFVYSLLWSTSSLAHPKKAEHHHDASETPAGVQCLDVYQHGSTLDLLVGEYDSAQHRVVLRHQRSTDHGKTWTPPQAVDQGLPAIHAAHRGMDAQIAAHGDLLIAAWMTSGTDAFGGGPLTLALSSDGGKTWQAGPNPADDGSTTGHGFHDLAADSKGQFHLTWLDTRQEKRGLRYAQTQDGGKSWSANATIDPETCECCWNTLSIGDDGSIAILYRDKDPRDMALAISPDGGKQWSLDQKRPVGAFNWQFNGCPHVGGGLAITGPAATPIYHAIVWTGLENRTGLHILQSRDKGLTWSAPLPIGTETATRPDLARTSRNLLAAVWDQSIDGKSSIMAAISTDQGATWLTTKSLSNSTEDTRVSHPRVIGIPDGFLVFWTEKAGSQATQWRSKSLSLTGTTSAK